jgi:uncharacterized membrane protein
MEVGHFLVYHLLPVILIVAGLHCIVLLLVYFHKKKKNKLKKDAKKTEKHQILWKTKSIKRRLKK